MAVDVLIRDETTGGDVLGELELRLEAERTTVGGLIEARVRSEVRSHNASAELGVFHGLVEPTDAERELNGSRLRRPRRVDAARQVEVARHAFERGRVLVLVDDRQRTDADEELVLTSGTTVTFLKLVPLVGG